MKRFSIFCAAILAAATSFAAVTYELNGGVTNDYGWKSKSEMFTAFHEDGGLTGMQTLEEYMAMSDPYTPFCGKLTVQHMQTAFALEDGAKWGWLKAYLQKIHTEQAADGASALDDAVTAAAWRFSVTAFFVEGQRVGWPKSANFAQAGKFEAFQPSWAHAYANPTEIAEGEFVLNAPYKEGYTFAGWCANADLTGAKVKVLTPATTGTLYAKWIDYVPTIAEVKAMEDNTETQVSGVVTFIQGKNVYIQDATGGMLLYMAAEPTFAVSQKVIVKGTKVIYGGAPEVKGCVEVDVEDATMPAPLSFENLTALVNDTELKYFATNVTVPGLVIAEYDSYNNPTVEDAAGNKAKCYKMVLDPAAYPVGCKVTVTAVAAWYNGFQFVGDVAGIVRPIAGKKEDYTFPVKGTYSLENNWVISNIEDNYAANKPGSTDYVRGMVAKDGIMYFINRETASIVRVDGKTGDMLEPIKLKGEHLFETASVNAETGETTWSLACQYPYNDIKIDNAGNFLIGGCLTSSKQTFFIYLVDITTGECTKLVEDCVLDNPGLGEVEFRFDAFGVAGDVTKNGVIMAADANDGLKVYRWLIADGVAGEGEQISVKLDPAVDQSLYINIAGFGTAPQIFPQDEEGSLFYVDGFNTLPMLFYGTPDEGASLVDDFINVPTGTKVTNTPDEVLSMNTGHNGLVEFQVGEEYFLLITASNTAASPASSFALYKFADEDRLFEGMEPLWFFPHNGMGTATNGCRTAVPSVDVISDTQAILYVYTNNNGYATYTLTIDPTITGVENVEAVETGARKVVENGQVFILKNGVKFNVLGSEVK